MAQPPAAPSIASVQNHFRTLLEQSGSSGTRLRHNQSGLLQYEKKPFFRHGLAADIITRKELEDRIIWLFHPSSATERKQYIDRILGTSDSVSSGSSGRGLHNILLIVLSFASQPLINAFKESFLIGGREKRDENLPFTEDTAKEIFNLEWKQFYKGQFMFAPITIAEGSFGVKYHHQCHLPYLEEEEIGHGTFGKVFKVKIERGHYRDRRLSSRNLDAVWLARKDFDPKKENYDAFQAENSILTEFLKGSTPESIMTSIGSYVQYPGHPDANIPSASIFFPVAKCSLKTYMEEDSNVPSRSHVKSKQHVKRMQHVRQMLSISKGLEWLSQNLVYEPVDGKYVYSTYYHCDLKPDNILVYEDLGAPEPVVFKIADFGEARGLRQKPQKGLQSKPKHIPVSGRAGTFIAPEAQDGQVSPRVSGNSDVWAFGCIFLLVIVFNYDGVMGIKQFDIDRLAKCPQSSKNRGDFFFNPEVQSGSGLRNEAVTKMIQNLTRRTKDRQKEESDANFSHEALNYIKNKILVHHDSRHSISQVTNELHRLYNNNKSSISGFDIEYLSATIGSKHCGISPRGSVFFYTPSWIKFYPQEPGGSGKTYVVEQKGYEEWSGRLEPTSRSCSNQTVCLVSARPVDAALKCTIHDCGQSSAAPIEVELTHLSENAVQSIALSPNGEMIAIAWKPLKDRAQICLYRISDIKTNGSGPAGAHIAGSSLMGTSSSNTTDADQLRGRASFRDIKYNLDLCFSRDSTTLYHAATTTGHATNLRVTAWSTSRTGIWASTKSSLMPYADFTLRQDFLMRLVPLNQQVGVLCISHDQVITKQLFYENETISEKIEIDGGRALSTVLISSDDKMIVALAEEESSKRYLEIWGGPLDSPRVARRLAIEDRKFNPKTDVAYLREDGQSITLQITFLQERKTRVYPLDQPF